MRQEIHNRYAEVCVSHKMFALMRDIQGFRFGFLSDFVSLSQQDTHFFYLVSVLVAFQKKSKWKSYERYNLQCLLGGERMRAFQRICKMFRETY